jgi:hypothetical protein
VDLILWQNKRVEKIQNLAQLAKRVTYKNLQN